MWALGPKRTSRLLDDLVGCGEQRLRNGQTKRPCGLEIDNQLILGRRLHRHVGWLLRRLMSMPRGLGHGINWRQASEGPVMSALGQKRTYAVQNGMSALPERLRAYAQKPEAAEYLAEFKQLAKCYRLLAESAERKAQFDSLHNDPPLSKRRLH